MRKLFLTYIIACLFPLYASAQILDSLTMYKKALGYISKDLRIKVRDIAVSDTIYNLDSFMFIGFVKGKALEKILRERQAEQHKDTFSSLLDKKFDKISCHTKYSIFFSDIRKGVLLAEIYELQGYGKTIDYRFVINTALSRHHYMIIFNRKNKIESAYHLK